MAQYVKVVRSIWTNEDFVSRSPEAQRIYFLLISQPDISHAGILPLLERRWARLAAGTTTAGILGALEELESVDMVRIDHDTDEVFVRSYIRYDEMHKVPNGKKAVEKAIDAVISPKLRSAAAEALDEAEVLASTDPEPNPSGKGSRKGSGKGYATPSTATGTATTPVTNHSSSSEPPQLNAAAARGVDIYMEHRVSKATDIGSPEAWVRKVRPEEVEAHRAQLEVIDPDTPAWTVAHRVFGISVNDARSAEYTLNRKEETVA